MADAETVPVAGDTLPDLDVERWFALEEDRKQGMGILVPRTRDEMETRRHIITKYRGIAPDQYLAFQADFHLEVLLAQRERRPIDYERFDMVNRISETSMSLKGWRADAIKDIASLSPKQGPRRTWVDAFMGRK